jgi:hypothetical protein
MSKNTKNLKSNKEIISYIKFATTKTKFTDIDSNKINIRQSYVWLVPQQVMATLEKNRNNTLIASKQAYMVVISQSCYTCLKTWG